jgi:hypothetical protein
MSGFPTPAPAPHWLAYNDLLGESCGSESDLSTLTASQATLFLSRIPLPSQILVTNLICFLAASGGTLTHSYMGLYNSQGVVLAQTADQSTGASGWGTGSSTGIKVIAVPSPIQVAPLQVNDFVWTAIYYGTEASQAGFMGLNSVGLTLVNAGTAAARSRMGTYAVANTATLPNITPANISPGLGYWTALN